MTVVELVRSCADAAQELGPYSTDGVTEEEPSGVPAMTDAQLITALQQALGEVRLFNMLEDDQ